MKSTLLIGYGNPDRQDDGVALHILARIASGLGHHLQDPLEDNFYPAGANPDLWFDLQLHPEMAETIANYDRVCFIDAHTGNFPEEIRFKPLIAQYHPSALTHHMTPESCLALVQVMNGRCPDAILVSVRGYAFGYNRDLSPQTTALLEKTVPLIREWLSKVS